MDVDTALMIQNIKKEEWYCQKNLVNLIIKKKMDPNKLHERVIEIQKNIDDVPAEEQTKLLSELLDIASKIEQSLAEIKIDDINPDEIQINEDEE
jgi:hypothetical protein